MIDAARLEVPIARRGMVRRGRLLERLESATDIRVVSVIAPPGAGKTSLLGQLARERPARVAWVTADDADNDAKQLLRVIVAALDRLRPIDPAIAASLIVAALASLVPAIGIARVASVAPKLGLALGYDIDAALESA
jgi:ATP/maltotriose-dependent transcriptional regulator MalT